MELYFSPLFTEQNFTLSPEESNHCVNVMRQRNGDSITITDGKGSLFTGTISQAHHKHCQIEVISTQKFNNLTPYLHIAIAPTKNIERLEWFLEKVTEIGINEITPILCQHSERKQVRIDRLEKIIIAAMKQSGKYHLPKLNDLTPFKEIVTKSQNTQKLIAHCNTHPKQTLKSVANHQNTLILIGPEGDFSVPEIEMAMTNGFIGVSLGESRLRTETAGIVACHTIRLMNE